MRDWETTIVDVLDVPLPGSQKKAGAAYMCCLVAAVGCYLAKCGYDRTHSACAPNRGLVAAPGAVGEYSGEFMCDRYVRAALRIVRHAALAHAHHLPQLLSWPA